MTSCKLYLTVLAVSLLLGMGIFAVMPSQGAAAACGDGCNMPLYCCQGQGSCDPGLYQWGECRYSPPGVCNQLCSFRFLACVLEDYC
ncbi:MAG TPA: hypothetical protein VN285_03270 [Candidatus Deferrimicrobium sp.]|nr:hypothetical protein [Candidatus Deferrimicrobium sp.]